MLASDREPRLELYPGVGKGARRVLVRVALHYGRQLYLLTWLVDERCSVAQLVRCAHPTLENTHLEVVTRTS